MLTNCRKKIDRGPERPQQIWRSTATNDLRELELGWEDVATAAEDRQR